ncbi:hypothetical protein RhiXN_06088 [Rhizoctonia solani]|uniref:Oxidoreductase N-terminal domain-containing protein n=1 Tax=Rhizoctonia solani TaxID=456999 RepID=A0A8H8SX16_9AGAM|nr:uncharacterized protein RhiXN_06088 [Rhizoctonia solani]QRW21099.1 hypothetical protein RhiXN_06088 [Rhizoctonia solani]
MPDFPFENAWEPGDDLRCFHFLDFVTNPKGFSIKIVELPRQLPLNWSQVAIALNFNPPPMTLPRQSTRIFLSERPNGPISDGTFKLATTVLPRPAVDQVVVRVDYISLDPAMRLWLDDARSYLPPIQIGETIRAPGVGTVVQGNSQLKEADTVYGFLGWAEYIIAPAKDLRKISDFLSPPEGAAVTDFLGPLGFNGMSACFGLLSVGKIKAGETLVVSGAAGATGSLVCQIGKIKGARVIGLASTLKCSYLVNQLGVDAALDYTSPTFAKRFLRYCRVS